MDSQQGETKKWYAIKVFQNKTAPLESLFKTDNVRYFIPSSVISSLAFVRESESYITELQETQYRSLWFYKDKGSKKPTPIPDREMEMFIFVATAGSKGLLFLGDDRLEYHIGNRVRVKDGPFKGAEGHIKRIKKDRRLVVSIHGVVAIATTYIHPDLLEIIEN